MRGTRATAVGAGATAALGIIWLASARACVLPVCGSAPPFRGPSRVVRRHPHHFEETHMTSRTRLRIGVGIVLGLALAALGCGGGAKEELVIGEYGSLTGNDADFGQSPKRGLGLPPDPLVAHKHGKNRRRP